MEDALRDERLESELQILTKLKESSTVFDFDPFGDPPNRYKVTFRGKGIRRNPDAHDKVETLELHQCDIRLPYGFPERPPDIRWLTPIFHPNVSFSGYVGLADIGITWEKALSLDVVCERLWDVARGAHLNLDSSSNFAAKEWYENDSVLRLPLDHRSIRDKKTPASKNIVQYHRRGESPVRPIRVEEDVLFIGEDTATPALPPVVSAQEKSDIRSGDTEGDDIFYIGDE